MESVEEKYTRMMEQRRKVGNIMRQKLLLRV